MSYSDLFYKRRLMKKEYRFFNIMVDFRKYYENFFFFGRFDK